MEAADSKSELGSFFLGVGLSNIHNKCMWVASSDSLVPPRYEILCPCLVHLRLPSYLLSHQSGCWAS